MLGIHALINKYRNNTRKVREEKNPEGGRDDGEEIGRLRILRS